MSHVYESQIFYVTSENRNSGETYDFSINLPLRIGNKFDSVVVLAASLPLSYYLIRPPYDTFILIEDGVSISCTIESGNYNSNTFITEVTNLLNTNSPHGWVYNMSMDTKIAKYTYTVSGNGGMQPSLVINRHLGDQMGFEYSSTNTFVGDSLLSTRVVNFVSTNALFIHSPGLLAENSSILQEIYSSNTIPYSYITWLNPGILQYAKRIVNNRETVYNFTLTDEEGVKIELNGCNYNFTLMFFRRGEYDKAVEYEDVINPEETKNTNEK